MHKIDFTPMTNLIKKSSTPTPTAAEAAPPPNTQDNLANHKNLLLCIWGRAWEGQVTTLQQCEGPVSPAD